MCDQTGIMRGVKPVHVPGGLLRAFLLEGVTGNPSQPTGIQVFVIVTHELSNRATQISNPRGGKIPTQVLVTPVAWIVVRLVGTRADLVASAVIATQGIC